MTHRSRWREAPPRPHHLGPHRRSRRHRRQRLGLPAPVPGLRPQNRGHQTGRRRRSALRHPYRHRRRPPRLAPGLRLPRLLPCRHTPCRPYRGTRLPRGIRAPLRSIRLRPAGRRPLDLAGDQPQRPVGVRRRTHPPSDRHRPRRPPPGVSRAAGDGANASQQSHKIAFYRRGAATLTWAAVMERTANPNGTEGELHPMRRLCDPRARRPVVLQQLRGERMSPMRPERSPACARRSASNASSSSMTTR